ncbi:helix-turn-helix domain-containing protein [Streptomyces sp. NPDC004726]
MPAVNAREVGQRIAYQRSIAKPKLTQQQLADAALIHVGTLRKIERGARGMGDGVLDAIAAALGVDSSVLLGRHERGDGRVHLSMPALSAAIATYDMPCDGPVRSLAELEEAVDLAVGWRLGAQYVRISRQIPDLLSELARALDRASTEEKPKVARLLTSAYRAADAVAFKYRAFDLSARLVDLMRWAAPQTEDPLVDATVAYVRAEIHFAANAYIVGLRALEQSIDRSLAPGDLRATAARGSLRMRAAVVAGRAGNVAAATTHLREARGFADQVPEGVYQGTAFGPDSVRIHEVSVAVSLGGDHASRALGVAAEWKPSDELPAERRSGFYIELARAQLWSGRADDAFESLKVARRIAPQHTREHPWVREDAATLRRLKRADAETLTNFADWCNAGG